MQASRVKVGMRKMMIIFSLELCIFCFISLQIVAIKVD